MSLYDDVTFCYVEEIIYNVLFMKLRALDHVFKDEIVAAKGANWTFASFIIYEADSVVQYMKCTNFECGIYVVKCMEAAYNNDKICVHVSD